MATAGNNLSVYDKSKVPNAKDFRFGIVVSKWNADITEGLFKEPLMPLKIAEP